MYPTLDEIKTFLGVTGTEDDEYLTLARAAVIDAIEQYCQRKFELLEDADFWMDVEYDRHFYVSRFPVTSISEVTVDGAVKDPSNYKFHPDLGMVTIASLVSGDVNIAYTGGFDPIPPAIDFVIYNAVKDAYGSKDTDSNAGAIKSERVDGALTVTYFDAATTGDDGSSAANTSPLIARYAFSLDPFMSEQAVGAMY